MKMLQKVSAGILTIAIASIPQTVKADPTEWVLEKVCEFSDVVDCNFEEPHETYNLGSFNFLTGGMGKIRSQAAYCLLRDAREQRAASLVGEDWYEFGVKSRYHLIHSGQEASGAYTIEGQRLLDLVLFGETLRGIELQNLTADFLSEAEKGYARCLKKLKIGKKEICTQFSFPKTAHYMDLKTNEYSWSVDIDDIIEYLTETPLPGFEMTLGQNVPFEGAEGIKLSGSDLNLVNGILPPDSGNNNSWVWGAHPCPTFNLSTNSCPDPVPNPTTYLNGEFPLFELSFADVTLVFEVGLDGFLVLNESPDPDSTGDISAMDPDYTSSFNSEPSPLGGGTSVSLASGMAVKADAIACFDYYFDEWCYQFEIVKESKIKQRIPLNWITYGPNGQPLTAKWVNSSVISNPTAIQNQINSCLAAPPIDNEPEEIASAEEWQAFTEEVNTTFGEHFFICQYNEPTDDTSLPTFKLCDSLGNVYEADGGAFLKNNE